MKKIVLSLIVLGFIYAFSASEAMAQGDCKNFLGRAREKICTTSADYVACNNLVKEGSVDVCVLAGSKTDWVRRATFAEAKTILTDKKCTLTGNRRYMCADNYVAYCHGFKNFFSLMVMKDSPIRACEIAPKIESSVQMGDAGGITAVPLHHFYQLKKDFFHFYTANQDSAATTKQKAGWKYVGITGYVFPKKVAGTVELYGAVKSEFGGSNHFYTTDMKEVNNAILNLGWTADGIVGYVAKKQLEETVPLYRLYLPCNGQPNDGKFRAPCEEATGGDVHYYTTSLAEKDYWVKNGMKYIGIAAYIWTTPVTVDQ
jgi:hypothetical protein